jgi:O-acetyl-ADP-ribose deacetylase (regulator of RNase III)
MMKVRIGRSVLELVEGDITEQNLDAIVNAANEGLRGGGGVDGAIHRAGGPEIMEECRRIGRCPTGSAVITTGGRLPARHVIHTVGPVWSGGIRGEPNLLASAYRSSLQLAEENRVKSVAFPSISTGVYGYPIDQAARIALRTVSDYLKGKTSLELVRFVLFGQSALNIYVRALEELAGRDEGIKRL